LYQGIITKSKLLCNNVMEVHKIGTASNSTYLGTFLKYNNIIFCIILSILYFFRSSYKTIFFKLIFIDSSKKKIIQDITVSSSIESDQEILDRTSINIENLCSLNLPTMRKSLENQGCNELT